MKKSPSLPVAALFSIMLALSLHGAALAGKGKGHHHKGGQESGGISWSADEGDKVTIRIKIEDRAAIKGYIRKESGRHCPPGLAKKNNGCLPPGIAKKYALGKKLPDDVTLDPLPVELLELLGPAPKGYMYARVDKDVLLVAEATKKVVDAVTLLSAVGN